MWVTFILCAPWTAVWTENVRKQGYWLNPLTKWIFIKYFYKIITQIHENFDFAIRSIANQIYVLPNQGPCALVQFHTLLTKQKMPQNLAFQGHCSITVLTVWKSWIMDAYVKLWSARKNLHAFGVNSVAFIRYHFTIIPTPPQSPLFTPCLYLSYQQEFPTWLLKDLAIRTSL